MIRNTRKYDLDVLEEGSRRSDRFADGKHWASEWP